MKLKNQNVNEDGTTMLKNIASADEEIAIQAKKEKVDEEPIEEKKPVKKVRNASKKDK